MSYLVQLHTQFLQYFNMQDLELLCFGLGVEFEDLPGNTRPIKAISFLKRIAQLNRLPTLILALGEVRPNVSWPGVPVDFDYEREIVATLAYLEQAPDSGHPRVSISGNVIDIPYKNTVSLTELRYTPPTFPDYDSLPTPGSLPPRSYMPYDHNEFFTGRVEALMELAQVLLFDTSGALGLPQTAIASGIGGIGKTQLAVEFAYCYGRFFSGGVFWLNLTEAKNVPAEVALIGSERSMALYRSNENLTLEEQVNRVKRAWQEATPRLLIFDNCENATLLKKWRPPSGGCRVLVTSRKGDWSNELGIKKLRLGTLTRDESKSLLCHLAQNLTDEDAYAIAAELADLPLALHLAGNFLARYSQVISPEKYLDQLQKTFLLKHPSLQGRGTDHSPTEHELHVERTFALSHEQLQPENNEIDKVAITLLAWVASLAPGESIPFWLLQAAIKTNDAENMEAGLLTQDGLARLIGLGLLVREEDNNYQMHRLLVQYTRKILADEIVRIQPRLERVIIEKASEVNRFGFLVPLPTWQSHLHHVTKVAETNQSDNLAWLLHELGQHLEMTADYQGAQLLYEQALKAKQEMLGKENPDTAESLCSLAGLWAFLGDYTQALPLYQQALDIYEVKLGKWHPSTAAVANNLGALLMTMGDYEGARLSYNNSLDIKIKTLGDSHPSTATAYGNLGSLLASMGDYQSAKPLLERSLAICEATLGTNHVNTATCLSALARLLQDMGDYFEAKSLMERSITIYKTLLGNEHPYTALSLHNLARLLRDTGDFLVALSLFERALNIRMKKLGMDHPETAESLNDLGDLKRTLGDTESARLLIEQALAIRVKVLGISHPSTADSLYSLAILLHEIGKIDEAKAYLQEALAIREKTLGLEHPNTAMSLWYLAKMNKDSGNSQLAISLLEQAFPIFEQKMGSEHSFTQNIYQQIKALRGNF